MKIQLKSKLFIRVLNSSFIVLIKNVKLIPRSIPALNILLSKSVTTTTNKINQDDPLVLIERENSIYISYCL